MGEPDTRLQRRSLDAAFRLASTQVADGTAPFVILGVADERGVIRLEAHGPVGPDAVCLLASITKPIVATVVMANVEAGLVDLAEPLASTLPALDRPGVVPFGAWHVLSHTSGILDLDLEALVSAGADRAELLRAMLAQPQVTAPGSAYAYTSLTFDLLVEAVGLGLGRPFEEALHSRLLDPLGMADTVFDPRPAHAARMAPATVGGWDGIHRHDAGHDDRRLLETFISLRLGGAGLWSTADDLLRFGRAMLRRGELDGHRVLSPAFVELMTREVTTGGLGASPDPLEAEHYALGWGKPGVADPGSSAAFHHGGLTGTRLWIDPAHHLVYAYLTGAWGFDHRHIDAVGNAIYAALP